MTHISRPFQIALAAIVLFVAVWFVALRGHSSGTESSGPGASSTVPATTPQQASGSSASPGSGSSSSPSAADHATAPGVAGLTRAIAKARGAVAQQQKSDHASTSASPQPTHTSSTGASHGSSAKSQQSPAAAAPAKATPKSAAKTPAKSGVPAMQLVVESQLKQGKVVAILFWNPKGTVDAVVRRELQAASRTFGGQLAVHVARSGQVGSFGTFTRAVQVYGTPTILMVNTKGVTSSVPGLKDAFSIEQAVREVKQAH